MKKVLLTLLVCSVFATPSIPRAQFITTEIATEIGGSLLKSVLGAFGSNIMAKLFGTPDFTPEQAAQQLKTHFEKLELDHEQINKATLASRVHDYIVSRNDPKYSFADRRKAVRLILHDTNILEGMLTRLLNDGYFEKYAADYMLVSSTRLTFIAEQAYVEASERGTQAGQHVIRTNNHALKQGQAILAAESTKHLRLLANELHRYVLKDKSKHDCLKKPENLPWFSGDGTPLGNQLVSHWHNGNHIWDARHQFCIKWMFGDSDMHHHFPPGNYFMGGGYVIPNPKRHDQVLYRYKGNDAYWLGVASSTGEAYRQTVGRSMDNYADKIGKPSQAIESMARIVAEFGNTDQKGHAGQIYRYYMNLDKPLAPWDLQQ